MTVPLVVLAILSTVGGLVGIPYAISSMFGGAMSMFLNGRSNPSSAKAARHTSIASRMAAPGEHGAAETAVGRAPAAAEHATHNAEEISTERTLAGRSRSCLRCSASVSAGSYSTRIRCGNCRRYLSTNGGSTSFTTAISSTRSRTLSREGLWKGFDVGFIDGIVNGIGHFVDRAWFCSFARCRSDLFAAMRRSFCSARSSCLDTLFITD